LIDVHAFRPGQVGRVLAKIKKQITLRVPSGFQTVIGKDRIYIKRSRTRYSAYTSEMRDSKNTPVPMNPPTTEQETAVRDQDGNIIDGTTISVPSNMPATGGTKDIPKSETTPRPALPLPSLILKL
jgi:hypothetical protein